MDNTKEVLTQAKWELKRLAQEEKNLQEKKEQSELEFKRDCRRTAMQLASRSKIDKADDAINDAEKYYKWLTEPDTDQR